MGSKKAPSCGHQISTVRAYRDPSQIRYLLICSCFCLAADCSSQLDMGWVSRGGHLGLCHEANSPAGLLERAAGMGTHRRVWWAPQGPMGSQSHHAGLWHPIRYKAGVGQLMRYQMMDNRGANISLLSPWAFAAAKTERQELFSCVLFAKGQVASCS